MEREEFARRVTAHAGWPSHDRRLFEAFRDTPRERFLPPGTPPGLVYADTTVGLGLRGINNGQPSLHALCLAALRPAPGEIALHAGAGSGYYTAVLARLVGPEGRVEAYEVEPTLAARARDNLIDLPQAAVHAASGAVGPLPACDLIYGSCGATGPAEGWLDALRPGGRLLFPLTGEDGTGAMLLATRPQEAAADPGVWPARLLVAVAFVDCWGARQPEDERAVTAAFTRGRLNAVRYLVRGASRRDTPAWCVGQGWQLTT